MARLGEFLNSMPEAVTLKLGVAPVFRRGAFFARGNLGFERNLDVKHGTIPDVVHIDAGVGVDLGGSAVMLESANLLVPDEQHGGEVTSKGFTLHELAVSARGHGAVSPFAAVIVPLDDDLREFIKVALTVGAEFAFQASPAGAASRCGAHRPPGTSASGSPLSSSRAGDGGNRGDSIRIIAEPQRGGCLHIAYVGPCSLT